MAKKPNATGKASHSRSGKFTLKNESRPKISEPARGTDFARLDRMTDDDIARQIAEDPDVAPEFTNEMIAQARWVTPTKKVPISFRVDPDVLEFFKREGEGYQSRMNAVLRAFMNAERREGKK